MAAHHHKKSVPRQKKRRSVFLSIIKWGVIAYIIIAVFMILIPSRRPEEQPQLAIKLYSTHLSTILYPLLSATCLVNAVSSKG